MNKDKFPAAKQNKAHAARVRLSASERQIRRKSAASGACGASERAVYCFFVWTERTGTAEQKKTALRTSPPPVFCRTLIRWAKSCAAGAASERISAEIDSLITDNMTGWTIDRLSVCRSTIIRLAVYECMIAHTVNVKVALSEAVLLAQEFGSEESPRFVNGVLARIVNAAAENDQKS